ncbi:MAG TPA: hypothetical protein DCY20_07465 [Firmicutes bacterium]|nr:hypothetical protein [Bacillota bacterium]
MYFNAAKKEIRRRYKMKKQGYIGAMIVLLLFVAGRGEKINALQTQTYESGIYEVQNDVYHEQEIGMVMSRNFLQSTMKVEVRKNSVTYYISFIPSEYMTDYRMKLNDKFVEVEVVEATEEAENVILKIETNQLDANMEAVIYVEPMGRDVEFSVIPLLETMVLVENIEENSLNLIYLGGGMLMVALVGGVVMLMRNKKD